MSEGKLTKLYNMFCCEPFRYNTQVAGPLFFAVSEFVKASKHGAVHAASMVTKVLSLIAEPYSRGFCYNAGRDINLQLLHGPYYI